MCSSKVISLGLRTLNEVRDMLEGVLSSSETAWWLLPIRSDCVGVFVANARSGEGKPVTANELFVNSNGRKWLMVLEFFFACNMCFPWH